LLVNRLLERFDPSSYDLAWTKARVEARGFYESVGFTGAGSALPGPLGIPHLLMSRELRREELLFTTA
jgi:hypothetical protein